MEAFRLAVAKDVSPNETKRREADKVEQALVKVVRHQEGDVEGDSNGSVKGERVDMIDHNKTKKEAEDHNNPEDSSEQEETKAVTMDETKVVTKDEIKVAIKHVTKEDEINLNTREDSSLVAMIAVQALEEMADMVTVKVIVRVISQGPKVNLEDQDQVQVPVGVNSQQTEP